MPEAGICADASGALDLCVCIPARDEAKRLPALLGALAAQSIPGRIRVAISLNNTTDDSIAVIARARSDYGARLTLKVKIVTFPPALAHAGSARRMAMDSGLEMLECPINGVLVSTDADTRPPPDWLESIASSFAGGADIVGGQIVIDEAEALPVHVARLHHAWQRYWEAVRAIEDELDPLPWDPAPRHGDHTGASLAIRAGLYSRCGGVPLLRTGEDRALVAAAIAQGGRLAHPVGVRNFVSPRVRGRADAGMAQAMQEMFKTAESGRPLFVPGYHHWRTRASWRRAMRGYPGGQARIVQEELMLPPMPNDMILKVTR